MGGSAVEPKAPAPRRRRKYARTISLHRLCSSEDSTRGVPHEDSAAMGTRAAASALSTYSAPNAVAGLGKSPDEKRRLNELRPVSRDRATAPIQSSRWDRRCRGGANTGSELPAYPQMLP